MKVRHLLIVLFAVFAINASGQIYLDTSATVADRVADLLSKMSLEEKVGQMTQVNWGNLTSDNDITTYYLGSLINGGGLAPNTNTATGWADMYDNYQNKALATSLGIPLLYGTDALHGHNGVKGAVLFPHNVGLGCTRNDSLVEEIFRITAVEVAGTGIDWTFSPTVAVSKNDRWGRAYESFSENVDLVTLLGNAGVRGLQGSSLSDSATIMACAKHYIGDGGTQDGIDRGNAVMSETELRAEHLPPYIGAINEGVSTVMASFSSYNGDLLHGNSYLINDVLKTELGFEGFVVSDWAGINSNDWNNYTNAIKIGINAGIDMVMVPDQYVNFINGVIANVNTGDITQARIDDAVTRILTQKISMGLFEEPLTNRALTSQVGSAAHRTVARQAVRESMVVLKNKNKILPLSKTDHIHMAGRISDDLGLQLGGWSIWWQGGSGDITTGTSIKEGMDALSSGTISHNAGGYSASADGAEVAVAVIGENPYAELYGDREDLRLNAEDITLVKSLYEKGFKVVTVIVSGRPMIIEDILHYSDAIVAAWLPGTEGTGVADILFGDYKPTGLLSFTWPKSMDQIPINDGDANYDPLFPYGYGITDWVLPSVSDSVNLFSTGTDSEGKQIEITYDKPMQLPSLNSFIVTVNGVTVTPVSISLKQGDDNTIIFTMADAITYEDVLHIQSTGTITSTDLSIAYAIDVDVYNGVANYFIVPGFIEAEDYYVASGVQTEECSDVWSDVNVGFIDAGDYLEYQIDVQQTGLYSGIFRVAGEGNGEFDLKITDPNVELLTTVTVDPTGGWQTWETIYALFDFSSTGKKNIQFDVTKSGFNLNYFAFKLGDHTGIEENKSNLIKVYPNPVNNDLLFIEMSSKNSKYKTEIKMLDLRGNIVYQQLTKPMTSIVEVDLKHLSLKGMYFIQVKTGDLFYSEKLIIE